MNLSDLTLTGFRQGLIEKKFSAREAITDFFNRIKKEDSRIKAYLSLNQEAALKEGEKIDEKINRKEDLPLLAGAPLAIKDNILIEGGIATAGSKILASYRAVYDATVIKKLKTAGAIFLGKTNLDEFAMGSSTEHSAFKITTNPYDASRVPGGSSGGSAAAVAGDLALAALGSDTGGSIRQPAAFCGIVGLKPTYGAVSRFGLIALASSLDQIGPLAKNVADAAVLFQILAGRDSFDATAAQTDYNFDFLIQAAKEKELKERVKKLKVGLPREYFADKLEPAVAKGVAAAIDKLKKLNVEFKEISLPHTAYALDCYYIIMPAEASANLARYDGVRYSRIPDFQPKNLYDIYIKQRGAGFGPEVKRRILLGAFVLSYGYYEAYYLKAQQVRRLIKQDFDKAFDKAAGGVDVILTPVTPTPAFKIGEKIKDPLSMYLSDIFTIPANLAGVPALSMPVKNYPLGGKELPVGFQLIGRPFQEGDILALGRYYELN